MKLKSALRQRLSKLSYRMVRLDLRVQIHRRVVFSSPVFLFWSLIVYRIRKGLIPREAVIVRLDHADFKEK
jgi:hypothetical protein